MEKWWQDFHEFRIFLTPKIMPFVFWAGVAIAVVMGIITLIEGALASSARLIFLGIVTLFLGPVFVRVLCELVMTFFRERE
jgi:hypothetical protein